MTGGKVLTNISEAIIEGLEILTKMEDLLKERHPYPITTIKLLKDKGKINFNFYWVKLFLKFRLNGEYRTHGGEEKESIQFEYPLIWGRYDILQNGIETGKQVVKDSKIQLSPGGLDSDLVYGKFIYPLKQTDNCLLIIDQIIYKCLPESMVKIENLELT